MTRMTRMTRRPLPCHSCHSGHSRFRPSVAPCVVELKSGRRPRVDRLPHPRADRAQLLLLLAIRLDDVAEERTSRPVVEHDWLCREALAAEVTLGVESHRIAQDDVIVTVLHAHRDEPLAGFLH